MARVGTGRKTQDERPLLVTGGRVSGALASYDALSGECLRRITPGNMTTLNLQAPWDGGALAP